MQLYSMLSTSLLKCCFTGQIRWFLNGWLVHQTLCQFFWYKNVFHLLHVCFVLFEITLAQNSSEKCFQKSSFHKFYFSLKFSSRLNQKVVFCLQHNQNFWKIFITDDNHRVGVLITKGHQTCTPLGLNTSEI